MLGILIRASVVALGLWLATVWVNGVSIDTPATLILAGVLLGIVNSIVRPIAILLTLPMTIVTLGLFLLVINAGMVALVALMTPMPMSCVPDKCSCKNCQPRKEAIAGFT